MQGLMERIEDCSSEYLLAVVKLDGVIARSKQAFAGTV